MNKTPIKWILIALLVIAIIIALYFLMKSKEPAPPPLSGGQPSGNLNTGIVDILGTLFQGIKNLFGKKDKKDYTGCKIGICDPKRPGYDECGFPDVNCGF